MKLNYAGKNKEFTPEEQEKLDKRLVRLGKLVERKGERVAHVAIKSTRHIHRAEIAMQFEAVPVVGIASAPDVYQAVCAAVDKLEKQVVKLHEKHREARRVPAGKVAVNVKVAVKSSAKPAKKPVEIFRIDGLQVRKPMTLDEAMVEMGKTQPYFVFPDADSGSVSVLIRRTDGHFDLVEC